MKAPHFLALCILVLCVGCSPSEDEARKVFDGAMRGFTPYPVAGITGYEIRAYSVVQNAGNIVAVKVTYASKSGMDIVQTKKFKMAGGRLRSADRGDIDSHIKATLEEIGAWIQLVYMDGNSQGAITWDKVVAKVGSDVMKKYGPESSVNGEDYSKIEFVTGEGRSLKLKVTDGDFHTIEVHLN